VTWLNLAGPDSEAAASQQLTVAADIACGKREGRRDRALDGKVPVLVTRRARPFLRIVEGDAATGGPVGREAGGEAGVKERGLLIRGYSVVPIERRAE